MACTAACPSWRERSTSSSGITSMRPSLMMKSFASSGKRRCRARAGASVDLPLAGGPSTTTNTAAPIGAIIPTEPAPRSERLLGQPAIAAPSRRSTPRASAELPTRTAARSSPDRSADRSASGVVDWSLLGRLHELGWPEHGDTPWQPCGRSRPTACLAGRVDRCVRHGGNALPPRGHHSRAASASSAESTRRHVGWRAVQMDGRSDRARHAR